VGKQGKESGFIMKNWAADIWNRWFESAGLFYLDKSFRFFIAVSEPLTSNSFPERVKNKNKKQQHKERITTWSWQLSIILKIKQTSHHVGWTKNNKASRWRCGWWWSHFLSARNETSLASSKILLYLFW
jgi:hypothetical protein